MIEMFNSTWHKMRYMFYYAICN